MWFLLGAFVLFFIFYRLSQRESGDLVPEQSAPLKYWAQPRGLERFVIFSWNIKDLDPDSELADYEKFFKKLPDFFPDKKIFLEIEACDFFHSENFQGLFIKLIDWGYVVDLSDFGTKDLRSLAARRVLLNGLSLTLDFKNSDELFQELYELGEDGEFTAKVLLEEKDVQGAGQLAERWKKEGLNGALQFGPKDKEKFSAAVIDFLVDHDKVKSPYDLTSEEREIVPRPYMLSETGVQKSPKQMEGMSFHGWYCHAGMERLFMDSTGEIFRSACHQGRGLGNVHKEWRMETEPLLCQAQSCHDYFDLMTTKELRS